MPNEDESTTEFWLKKQLTGFSDTQEALITQRAKIEQQLSVKVAEALASVKNENSALKLQVTSLKNVRLTSV